LRQRYREKGKGREDQRYSPPYSHTTGETKSPSSFTSVSQPASEQSYFYSSASEWTPSRPQVAGGGYEQPHHQYQPQHPRQTTFVQNPASTHLVSQPSYLYPTSQPPLPTTTSGGSHEIHVLPVSQAFSTSTPPVPTTQMPDSKGNSKPSFDYPW
jgi:hypothetical protein